MDLMSQATDVTLRRSFHVGRHVQAGLCGGGILTLTPKWPGKPYCVASMHWAEDGDTITGDLGIDAASALELLEQRLEEDILNNHPEIQLS